MLPLATAPVAGTAAEETEAQAHQQECGTKRQNGPQKAETFMFAAAKATLTAPPTFVTAFRVALGKSRALPPLTTALWGYRGLRGRWGHRHLRRGRGITLCKRGHVTPAKAATHF